MFNFKQISIFTAALTFILFLLLLTTPTIVFSLLGVPEHEAAFFIARRTAMLFLGISLLSWLGRHAEHSVLRQAVCMGLSVSMFCLAVLGGIEFFRGYANAGIWLAIIIEITLGIAYLSVWSKHKQV